MDACVDVCVHVSMYVLLVCISTSNYVLTSGMSDMTR